MSDKYWASLPLEEIGDELEARNDEYKEFLKDSGMYEELRKSYRLYYGNSAIQEEENGQTMMTVNHYNSLLKNILNQVTNQRPAFQALAVNSDYESQADTQLASGLLDYYMRTKRLEDYMKRAVELALYLREGWVSCRWNVTGGEIYSVNPETGQPIYEGDVEFTNHAIQNVARDTRNKGNNHSWYIVSEQVNRWDLVAKYPEWKEQILAISSDEKMEDDLDLSYRFSNAKTQADQVWIKTFYHKKTAAMPEGRMVEFLDSNIILSDGPLPYKDVYLFRISGSEAFDTAFGHSDTFNLIPLQDAIDMEFSTILTNHNALGVQNILVPDGADVSSYQLGEGLNVIKYDPKAGKPEPLNLAQTPPEIFNFANMLIQNQEVISGQNAISRGNIPTQLSGTAMALIANQAIQFNSGVQQSYNILLENVGSALIELLQTYASTPRIAQIAGKSKRTQLKQFTGEDLNGISRVVVDSANSLSKTAAGKVELATNLLNSGLINTPEQYISVVNNGTLEPLYESDQSQLNLIRMENENMSDRKPVRALITDDHSLHVLEHSTILNSPEARSNDELAEIVLAHIQEHIEMSKAIDPQMMEMLKHTPIQTKVPPQQAPTNVVGNQDPVTAQAESIPQPNMPTPPDVYAGDDQ